MSVREFIPRTPQLQPSRGEKSEVSARDFTELSRQVQALSGAISADARPHLSSRFIDKNPEGTPVTLTLGAVNCVVHGLGRKFQGWNLASKNGPGEIYVLTDAEIKLANIDTTVYLPLHFENGAATTIDVCLVVW